MLAGNREATTICLEARPMFQSTHRGNSIATRQSRFEANLKSTSITGVLRRLNIHRHFRRHVGAIFACWILLLALSESKAQSGGATGTIVGSVVDSTGALIAGAPVNITETGTNVSGQTVTSSSGSFTVASLKPGTYRV